MKVYLLIESVESKSGKFRGPDQEQVIGVCSDLSVANNRVTGLIFRGESVRVEEWEVDGDILPRGGAS